MPSQSIIYYLAKYYILNRQVIYNTWASNNMLCASRNVDAFQLIYLILLSGQASVEIRRESERYPRKQQSRQSLTPNRSNENHPYEKDAVSYLVIEA